MESRNDNEKLLKDAALLQLQKSNALEQQLKAIRQNTEQTAAQLLELQKELKKTRRSLRILWTAELLGPLLAMGLILGGAWFSLKYVEQHYLGGESLIDKVLMKNSPGTEKPPAAVPKP